MKTAYKHRKPVKTETNKFLFSVSTGFLFIHSSRLEGFVIGSLNVALGGFRQMFLFSQPLCLAQLIVFAVSLQIVVGHDSSVLAESAVYHTQRQRVLAAYQTATAQRDVVRHTRIVAVAVGVGILGAGYWHQQHLVPVRIVFQPGGV